MSAACDSFLYRPAECVQPMHRQFMEPDGLKDYNFIELWQVFPWMEYLYFPFEKFFDTRAMYRWTQEAGWVPIVSLAAYALMIGIVPKYTKRKPWKLNRALAAWNLLLAIFSFMGAIRTMPHLMYFVATSSFKETICEKPQMIFGDGATGLWCLLFTLSKVFELIDTLFVVLKGRQVIFLHWYHHTTVLVFTWATYVRRHNGLYFIAMNYAVHSAMYLYYFLMAVDLKPKWFNPMWITITQIMQMVVGVIITVFGFYYSRTGYCPGQNKVALYFQGTMYGSYLVLFLQFLLERFVFVKKGKGKKGVKQQPSLSPAVIHAAEQYHGVSSPERRALRMKKAGASSPQKEKQN